jgi:hypothetical protein
MLPEASWFMRLALLLPANSVAHGACVDAIVCALLLVLLLPPLLLLPCSRLLS